MFVKSFLRYEGPSFAVHSAFNCLRRHFGIHTINPEEP